MHGHAYFFNCDYEVTVERKDPEGTLSPLRTTGKDKPVNANRNVIICDFDMSVILIPFKNFHNTDESAKLFHNYCP